ELLAGGYADDDVVADPRGRAPDLRLRAGVGFDPPADLARLGVEAVDGAGHGVCRVPDGPEDDRVVHDKWAIGHRAVHLSLPEGLAVAGQGVEDAGRVPGVDGAIDHRRGTGHHAPGREVPQHLQAAHVVRAQGVFRGVVAAARRVEVVHRPVVAGRDEPRF